MSLVRVTLRGNMDPRLSLGVVKRFELYHPLIDDIMMRTDQSSRVSWFI